LTGETLVEVRNLVKYFPPQKRARFARHVGQIRAVDGISFDVAEGETFGIVGESGCGKSTVVRLITRLTPATSGKVLYRGTDVTFLSRRALMPLRREVQVIFQDPYSSLNPRKTVGSIIGEPLIIHGITASRGERQRIVQEVMDQVGLNPEHYNRRPHEFSGGQCQRIGIARAVVLRPRLVVADEPVSALDVSIQAQILNLLRSLQADFGLTYVFISHNLSVMRRMCDRIAVMYLGKIVELADADQLYEHPRHPYTAALLSAAPVPDPEHDVTRRLILTGDVPSPANPPSGCSFHPRCPKVVRGVCDVNEPALDEKGAGDAAACHFPMTDAEFDAWMPNRGTTRQPINNQGGG